MHRLLLSLAGLLLLAPALLAQAPPKLILHTDSPLDAIRPSGGQVSVARSNEPGAPGIVIAIKPGDSGYPGVALPGPFDLSAYSHIQVKVANLTDEPLQLNVRLDNAGDWSKGQPTNTTNAYLQPRAKATVQVWFGQDYGKAGFKLKANAITQMLVFTGKAAKEKSFRIETIEALGIAGEQPPEKPIGADEKRVKPKDGILFGPGVTVDAAKQFNAYENSTASLDPKPAIRLTYPKDRPKASARFKLPEGRWDLHDALQVSVRVRNGGTAPFTPVLKVDSNGGATESFRTAQPLAPGAEGTIAISFTPTEPVAFTPKPDGNGHTMSKGAAAKFASDAVSGVIFSAEGEGDRVLLVDSIIASAPPPPALPDWLGKRPPVPGDWKLTFSDDFNGPELDRTKWGITSGNYWDKKSHFSKDNIEMKNGAVYLRFEKKRGHNNDDPKQTENDYQTGYLDTLNHFAQRYGYWESRVKVPSATGLWPAFWLMPDRGADSKNRSGTNQGGMEFDIWEPLTKWGKYRYNIAMHYDGYGKDHKALGTSVYAPADKDGFQVVGLLWTPKSAIYYANGKEVLRWEDERIANVPGYIIYTMVSGGWDNNTVDDTQLPSGVTIDWVRVWQRGDLAE